MAWWDRLVLLSPFLSTWSPETSSASSYEQKFAGKLNSEVGGIGKQQPRQIDRLYDRRVALVELYAFRPFAPPETPPTWYSFSNLPDFHEKRPTRTASPSSTHPDHPRPSQPLQLIATAKILATSST